MDRNLRALTHAEIMAQLAFGTFEVVNVNGNEVGNGQCYKSGVNGYANGYTLVARGGYETGKGPNGHTDSLDSAMHTTICKSGNDCAFNWRGSSNLQNWLNNVSYKPTNIKVEGWGNREVHGGFLTETENGINALNSYAGYSSSLKGQSMMKVWHELSCSQRYYTGHSLGGAAASVGHYLFEKRVKPYGADAAGNAIFGSGLAVTFAAPQAWTTTRSGGRSMDPLCSNKRFFLESTFGDDPVPGLTKIAVITQPLFNSNFDHGEHAYVIKTSRQCGPVGCSWRGRWYARYYWCESWEWCTEKNEVNDRGCDAEDGGGLGVWNHVQPYLDNLVKAVDEGNGGSYVNK
jgi:hypothetical protein